MKITNLIINVFRTAGGESKWAYYWYDPNQETCERREYGFTTVVDAVNAAQVSISNWEAAHAE